MNNHRLAAGTLGALAAVVLGASACATSGSPTAGGSGGPSLSAAPSVSVAPSATGAAADAVRASTAVLRTTSYTYTLTSAGMHGQGATDPNAQTGTMSIGGTVQGTALTASVVKIASQVWMKVDLGGQNGSGGIPTKWMHVDTTRLGNGSALGVDIAGADPADSSKLFDGMVSAQQVDATHYNVVIDLTRASGAAVDPNAVGALGQRARAVPATVTVDGQGRLSELSLDLSTLDRSLSSLDIKYGNFGTPVSATQPPASDTVEAPDAVYNLFHG